MISTKRPPMIFQLLVSITLFIVAIAFLKSCEPIGSPASFQKVIDSLKGDLAELKAEQESYQREKAAIRNEINVLSESRAVTEKRVREYQRELKFIKESYAEINYRYTDLSADSIRVLFSREFGN